MAVGIIFIAFKAYICPHGVRVKQAARVCTNTFCKITKRRIPNSKTSPWSFRRNRNTPIFVLLHFHPYLNKNFPILLLSSIFNLQRIVGKISIFFWVLSPFLAFIISSFISDYKLFDEMPVKHYNVIHRHVT